MEIFGDVGNNLLTLIVIGSVIYIIWRGIAKKNNLEGELSRLIKDGKQ